MDNIKCEGIDINGEDIVFCNKNPKYILIVNGEEEPSFLCLNHLVRQFETMDEFDIFQIAIFEEKIK